MGLFKKISKAVSNVGKAAGDVGKAINKTAIAATGVVTKTATGDVSGAVKDAGKVYGAAVRLNPLSRITDNKIVDAGLNNKLVRTLSFDTSREYSNMQKGFRDLEKKGEADKTFYQGTSALLVKSAAVGVAAKSLFTKTNYTVAQGVVSGIKAKDPSMVVGALSGLDSTGTVKDIASIIPGRTPASSSPVGGEYYSDDSSYSAGSSQIMVVALMGIAAYYAIKR